MRSRCNNVERKFLNKWHVRRRMDLRATREVSAGFGT